VGVSSENLDLGFSGVQSPKLVRKGILTVNVAGSTSFGSNTLAHGLGYTPLFFVFLRDEFQNYQSIPLYLPNISPTVNYRCACSPTELFVSIRYSSNIGSGGASEDFYYFLYDTSIDFPRPSEL